MMKKLSVIITSYNAEDTIVNVLNSIASYPKLSDLEIIIVDDCSKDSTLEQIKSYCEVNQSIASIINLIALEKNHGSPSEPRNIGISNAKGEYITFVDDDDYINSDGLFKILGNAYEKNLDFLTGYLKIVENNKKTIANRISPEQMKSGDIIDVITSFQSTKLDILVKKSLIQTNGIKFNSDLKIGEDTVFFSEIFKYSSKADYVDDYFCYYVKDVDIENPSSTQNFKDREILNQLQAWNLTEKNFRSIAKSYFKLRLYVGYRNLLMMLVGFSKGCVSEATFIELHRFTIENKKYLTMKMTLHARYQEIYNAILTGDYDKFLDKIKRRILINGYDLKFILPVIKYLERDFNIKVDEWVGHDRHDRHDEKKSLEMLGWADIIFSEWMLGNSVWYSKNKLKFQKMIIRAHRFELYTGFGDQVDFEQVDKVITVGNYYMEKFQERFTIPRHKMTIISNYVDESALTTRKNDGYKFNLAIAGILPSRKGYMRSLELIKLLLEENPKYKLYVIGGIPEEVEWIKNNSSEMEYFNACKEYIDDHGLAGNVVITGFVDRMEMFNDVGYILSLSDKQQPESFHLTPAEGVLSDSVALLLEWPGIEYIYPEFMTCQSVEEIKNKIIELNNEEGKYMDLLSEEKNFISQNYNIDIFLNAMNKTIDSL